MPKTSNEKDPVAEQEASVTASVPDGAPAGRRRRRIRRIMVRSMVALIAVVVVAINSRHETPAFISIRVRDGIGLHLIDVRPDFQKTKVLACLDLLGELEALLLHGFGIGDARGDALKFE